MKTHGDHTKEFLHFLEWREKDTRNIWKSYTLWCCFHDFMLCRTRPRTEREEERDIIQNAVCNTLWIPRHRADTLKPKALLEILDISTLDDIARTLYYNDREDD